VVGVKVGAGVDVSVGVNVDVGAGNVAVACGETPAPQAASRIENTRII
jgi:hypothetical protein